MKIYKADSARVHQIDMEMSFSQEDIMSIGNGCCKRCKDVKGDISLPFPRLTYDEAISDTVRQT